MTNPFRRLVRLSPKEWVAILKETVNEWSNDRAPRLGASLAFYTLLSLAPLVVVVVAVVAFVYGRKAAQDQLVWQMRGLIGRDGAAIIQTLLEGTYKPGTGAVATILGLLSLALGASSVVAELRDALNTIWQAPSNSGLTRLRSILRIARDRFYSFAMVLGIGFLLLVSLILNAWIAAMGRFFSAFLPTPEFVLQTATFVVSFLVISFLFAAIYKLLPDVRLKWSDVAPGAAFTSLLFTTGKQLIGLYLGKVSLGSAYGAAGSLVVLLVWVYYSAQLFFLGAEFTKIYTRRLGSHVPGPPIKGFDT